MKTLISESGTPLSYQVPDDRVAAGASLGNSALWVPIKSNGSVERIFANHLGKTIVGSLTIQYAGVGGPVVRHADHSTDTTSATGYVPLRQEAAGEFRLDPSSQQHRFVLPGAIHVAETIFLPLGPPDGDEDDAPLLYQAVRIENRSRQQASLRVTAFARMRGETSADVRVRYDASLRALVATNESDGSTIRVFGTTAPHARHSTTLDFGSAYDPSLASTLDGDLSATGDILVCLQSDFDLAPGDTIRFAVVTGIYPSLEAAAVYSKRERGETALARTEQNVRAAIAISQVLTPDHQVNLGAAWSKVNMRRVMACYPKGVAFTNDPGSSSNVVARDAAWFSYGCDHFMPSFSRVLLDTFASLQYENGKIPEYYNAVDGHIEDYGLNINDDTPLFMQAVNHHYRATGDVDWLRGIFPAVERAARYICSQVDERGLVFCSANDPRGDVWAIAGWRNIISGGYRINGAVTEINSLCAAALRSAHHLALNLGSTKKDAKWLLDAYESVRGAMERHLRNPENGLYYLNIDVDGVKHSDVTGDELFPVILRVCDEETGYRIVSRLNAPDFWTSAGLRTVSRDDPMYEPMKMTGLLGGVWPGLTWWYAFAAARYHPEFMVRALRSSFEHYSNDSVAHNTVPGEFSEWFDGESLVNRGMRLSPWEPPRFLWAAIEGVCGMTLKPDRPVINPLIPPGWRWVGLRRLPYHGRELTYFAVLQENELCVYATASVESKHDAYEFDEDVTDSVEVLSTAASTIALRRGEELAIMVGNSGTQTMTAPVDLSRVVDTATTYELRVYNSERDRWIDAATLSGADLRSVAVSVEVLGYRLLSLKPAKS